MFVQDMMNERKSQFHNTGTYMLIRMKQLQKYKETTNNSYRNNPDKEMNVIDGEERKTF